MSGDPAAEKDRLRAKMRALRRSIAPDERTRRGAQVEERLVALGELEAARTVLLFYSFGSEVATRGTLERLHGAGKRLLLPFLRENGMDAAELPPGGELEVTDYGPKEPARRVPVDPSDVDLVVAPGLAFDREGHRLGYGGGHYDRYLARLGTVATRVGIGFAFQLLDRVPHEPQDERLDVVVTDAETVRVG